MPESGIYQLPPKSPEWESGQDGRYQIVYLPVTKMVTGKISGSKWPTEKAPDELMAGIRKSLPVSLPGAGVQRGVGRLRRPQKAIGLLKHRPSRQARPALCKGQG